MAVTATATEAAYNTSVDSAIDGKTTTSYKWFSLQENILDGTYHPMPAITGDVGWWGSSLSDVSGVLASNPALTVTSTQKVESIKVYGDPMLNEYPVDFTVKLYNGAALLYTQVVTGNTNVAYFAMLSQTYDVTSMVFTFTKVNKANRAVKIVDLMQDFIVITTDNLIVGLDILALMSMYKFSHDDLLIAQVIEGFDVTVNLSRPDNLMVLTDDKKDLNNIYTVLDKSTRQVFGKVKITYTSPFNDESLVLSTSEPGAYNTDITQTADQTDSPNYKWFSLHDNVLDGTYHPLPKAKDYDNSVGWWGTQFSDAAGVLVTPTVITIQFSARHLTNLKLSGDSLLNCFPVDFVFKAYDINGIIVYTRTVAGNTQVKWKENITPVPDVVKLVVTITKINRANYTVKLTEVFTAIEEEYDNEMISSMHILEEMGYHTGSIPMGNVSSNELDLVLSNVDRRFDLNNIKSPLYGYVKRNRRIQSWLGAYIGGTMEWAPMGTFWTTTWDIPSTTLEASITARDRLELLRLSNFDKSIVYQAYTLYQLFELILLDAGLTASQYDIDSALKDITIPYAWFLKMSHRDALQRLAGCDIIQVFCTKDDKVRVNLHLDATPTSMVTFDDDVNVFSSRYPLAVAEHVNYIEVTALQWVVDASGILYDSIESLVVPANSSVTKTYEFSSTPVVSVSAPTITAPVGISVTAYTLYAWGIAITYGNTSAAAETVTHISVSGSLLKQIGKQLAITKDDTLINADGILKATVEHDFIQSTTYAQSLADEIFNTYKLARYDVQLDNRGQAALRLGDRVTVNDSAQNVALPYLVYRQDIAWNGYLSVVTEGKKL